MTIRGPDTGLWLVDLDEPRSRAVARFATVDDVHRSARRPDPTERARHLTHRGWLRVLLARHMGIGPRDIVLRVTPTGRPYVPGSRLRISAAHSHGKALYAIAATGEVGVDLQWHDPGLDWRVIVRVFGSPREYAVMSEEVARSGVVAFYDWWCRKEAVLKARGTGFGESLRSVCLDLPRAGIAVDSHDGRAWSLWSLTAPLGFSAALARSPVSEAEPPDRVAVADPGGRRA